MRKKFGLLFQDGALFGSMNIYDNVAFPLRQHTDKGEEEIESIVTRRLREVGLGEAHFKMPNELFRRHAQARLDLREPSCSTRRSSCSTSPTRVLTRCGRRCFAS